MLLEDLGTTFTFQTFDDKKKHTHLARVLHGTLADCMAELELLNRKGAGVYVTINETDLQGREAENITRVRALFVDLDDPNPNRTFDYFLPPSAVIESSPGKHQVYWILDDDLPLPEFRAYQKALISLFGGDPRIQDLPRVMRVPGFYHHKGAPFLVRQIIDTGLTYRVEELGEWLSAYTAFYCDNEPTPPPEKKACTYEDPDAVREFTTLISALASAGEGSRNDTLNKVAYQAYGLVHAGRLPQDTVTEILTYTGQNIGLEELEVSNTLKSARRKAPPVINDLDLLPDISHPAGAVDTIKPEDSNDLGVEIINGEDVAMGGITWLWPNWIAAGEIHIFGGVPSTGKTTVCLKIGATMSRGDNWPDGSPCKRRNVVIWSAEDSFKTTIKPRLVASGADMRYIKFIEAVREPGGKRAFDPARDMRALTLALKKIPDVGLLIMDPIVSAVSGDSHKNNEVRRGLQPLADLGRDVNCAIIGITHLTKGTQGREPIERITGSIAFGALARLVWMSVKTVNEDNTVTRIFMRAKSNLGYDAGGFKYILQVVQLTPEIETTRVVWGEYVEGQARDILSDSEQTLEERSELDNAKHFLQEYLHSGPRDARSIEDAARRAGISRTTLARARKALKIKSVKTEFGGRSEWVLNPN